MQLLKSMPAATDPHAVTVALRHAATIIQHATTTPAGGDPDQLTDAHRTLHRYRTHTTGPLRHAIDTYLDDTTWHDGPLALLAAINTLAWQLDIPNPHTLHITEQLTLF
jgi:hypothetical protein